MEKKKKGRPEKVQIDKDYLLHQYCDERISTVEIAKEFGCDPSCIRHRLKKYGVSLRSLSESHLSGYEFNGNKNVFYGSILGDACLIRRNKNGLASFSKSNINYDHVRFVGSELCGDLVDDRIKEGINDAGNPVFKITLKCCEMFDVEHKRWYLEDKTKIVPKDFQLNAEILLHWFLDDGHSSWKNKQKTRSAVGFSTESFTKTDCLFLCDLLDNLHLKSYLGKSHGGFGYKVFLRACSIIDFFDLIGPSPVASMEYKWKY